jgi:hypothetical protein
MMLAFMRHEFPTARFILYMWDSIANRQSVVENLSSFDACFSFDPVASRQFGMTLRPLFFSRGFEARDRKNVDYQLSFVGTGHTDRFAVVSAVDSSLPPSVTRMWYLYLQAPWVFYAYKISNPDFRGAPMSSFRFEPLAKQSVQDIFFRSHAVLDIEHTLQSGLTMRTFEAMGASKKLVTTNPHIRDYDFYNPDNVCVIDRKAAQVPAAFLDSPYVPISDELYGKYRLEGWLDELLGGKEKQPVQANCQS